MGRSRRRQNAWAAVSTLQGEEEARTMEHTNAEMDSKLQDLEAVGTGVVNDENTINEINARPAITASSGDSVVTGGSLDVRNSSEIGKTDDFVSPENQASVERLLEERAELTAEVNRLQTELEQMRAIHAQDWTRMLVEQEARHALMMAGARNLRAAMALIDLGAITIDQQGFAVGLEEQIAVLVQSCESGFLFEKELPIVGNLPGEGRDEVPVDGGGAWQGELLRARQAGDLCESIRIKRAAARNGVCVN